MPINLDPSFVKADSTNLPVVNIFMVWKYIMTSDRYNSPEIRGIKVALSSRENYGDSAIGYVCVKREGFICIVKGRICPEHRVRAKDYTVVLKIDEKMEVVVDVQCLDCAASEGGCKHGIAFLMWANRRYEAPSPTEIECYWRKSTLSSIGSSIKFITASKMTKNSESTSKDYGDNSSFFNKVIEECTARQLDSQLSRHTFEIEERLYMLSIHQLIFHYCQKNDSCDDFLEYAENKICQDLCAKAEEKTRDQKEESLWHEFRYGRITASNIYEASRCATPEGSLVNKIIGAAKVFDNIHMERGRKLEKLVISEIEKQMNIKFNKCGIILIPSLPILGASPDGINADFVLEVKCPSSEKTLVNYLQNGQPSKKCKAQINLQMLAAKKKKGLFCVADPNFQENKKFLFVWVEYDEEFTNEIIQKAVHFWKQSIFPILFNAINK